MTLKTVSVEVTESDVFAILQGAKKYLGRIVAEYDGRGQVFRHLIDDAKADVAKWQAMLDILDKPE